jgi:hypothetical protein
MLSQLDTRYFTGLESCYRASLDFSIFPLGSSTAIASSRHNALWDRNVNAEVELEAGEYVVQVRIDRKLVKDKDAPIPLACLAATRKLARKKAEMLMSCSIAASAFSFLPPPLSFLPSLHSPLERTCL